MEQVPTWLAAAITAAGVSTVYNSDDWGRSLQSPSAGPLDTTPLPPTLN